MKYDYKLYNACMICKEYFPKTLIFCPNCKRRLRYKPRPTRKRDPTREMEITRY